MTNFFQRIFSRYPIKTRRTLEIMPGFVSWMLILFPIWGTFFIPYVVAYFILFFDVYWFYKSINLMITAFIGSKRIKEAENTNWLQKAKNYKDFKKISHVVVIPNYKENVSKMRVTLESISHQTFPAKQIYIVLAMEKREEEAQEKANILIDEFKKIFGDIFASYHPDVANETKGKSSNQAFGARLAYEKLVESGKIDINFSTISSVDADSIFDKQYFAFMAENFLKDPIKAQSKFWQGAIVTYNNFWKVPAAIRIITFFGSLWRIGLLVQKDRLITHATYSLSFKMLKEIDFWDTDVIPEDYRIFFKAFYKKAGQVWVEPIFLKTSIDAPQSTTYVKTLKNKYEQERRWSWGASDDGLFIKWWLTVPNVPFIRKTMMLYNVLIDHFLWPVYWFIITIAANIMPFINPVFSRTTLGYNLPRIAGLILTLCIFATLAMIVLDFKNRAAFEQRSKARQLIFPLEFLLLPIVGFFLSTLPALISHTQLMLGKRLEYKVTEKI